METVDLQPKFDSDGDEILQYVPRNMHLWESSSNYLGTEYNDYYIAAVKHRDSGLIDVSNYEVMKKHLLPFMENGISVLEIRSGHWGVGYIETLLIHKRAFTSLEKADDLLSGLSDYPVIDDDDLSKREFDRVNELLNSKNDFEYACAALGYSEKRCKILWKQQTAGKLPADAWLRLSDYFQIYYIQL